MQLPRLSLLVILAFTAPVAVSACEGECIVAVTDAWIGNYSIPIDAMMNDLALHISRIYFPDSTSRAMSSLQPLLAAFNNESYNRIETAVFPSYFHGKCQVNGVDPDGCPDPDCPVVCGTPGSLVHFFPTLRSIVFGNITSTLVSLAAPSSSTYKMILKALYAQLSASRPHSRPLVYRQVDASLRQILEHIPSILKAKCGGNGLPNCSWEKPMKEFILSFP